MFDIIRNIIGYSGSSSYNIDSYVLSVVCALIVVLVVIFIDLIFKVFRAFIPRSWR